MADYGRAAFDIRSRFFVGGTITLPYGMRLSPFLTASSGSPYNITLGQDLIGSSLLNQRPAFASPLSNPANIVNTQFGAFDKVPVPGETLVPINYLTGPSQFSLNLRLAKTISFGKLPEGKTGQIGARQNGRRTAGRTRAASRSQLWRRRGWRRRALQRGAERQRSEYL